jgi:hypothetical protein
MAEIINILTGLFKPDERFVMHRYYSSRFALIVGLVLLVIGFNYELIVNNELRLDFAIILIAMALAKIIAMLYYRISQ